MIRRGSARRGHATAGGASIEIISVNQRPLEEGAVKSAVVDAPAAGAALPGYSIEIYGSAVASEGAVDCVEILHAGHVVRTAPVVESPGNLFGAFGLRTVEFRTRVNLLGLPLELTLQVAIKMAGQRVELAELTLRRKPLRVSPPPPIHPLMVTTPGRTGSVWFSRLVGEHPAIVSYRPFKSEPRVGSYWAYVLRALADPASTLQGLGPKEMQGNWWLAPEDTAALPRVHDRGLDAWLVEDHPERTARFCLESASDFYARVAALEQKTDVVYYAEKFLPEWVPSMLLELDVGAKEVFLVRDPRDQLASVVSWTSTGRVQFSKDAEGATTADEYLDWLASQTKVYLRHWQARSESSLLVRYEDLVLEPAPTLTRLFDYLGVDSSPETVAGILHRESGSRPEQQRRHQTSTSPEESVGRWRKDIRPELWDRVNEAFAPELESWYGA
jgi:hypothetical protein